MKNERMGNRIGIWEWMKLTGQEKKLFFILCGFYLLYFLPILLAGDDYIDDLGRSLSGYRGWSRTGRPLAELVIVLLNLGHRLQDMAPLPQLLALVLFAYTMVLLARRFYVPVKLPLLVGCLGLAIMSPFFLENLSYHFDSVTMVLALCLALSSYALPEDMPRRRCFRFAVISVLLMLLCYQAAVGAYISMAFLAWLFTEDDRRVAFHELGERFVALVVAGVLYKVLLLLIHLDAYSVQHAQLAFPWTPGGVQTILANLSVFARFFGLGFRSLSYLALALLLAFLVYEAWQFQKAGRGFRFLIAIFGMTFGSVAPQFFLQIPVFAARVLLSTTVLFLFFGILLSRAVEKKKMVVLLIVLLLAGFDLSYTYGQVLHRQSQSNLAVAREIISDIGRLDPLAVRNQLVMIGTAPTTREWQLAQRVRPIVAEMVPVYLHDEWHWGYKLLEHASNREWKEKRADDHDREIITSQAPVLQRDIYDIYDDGETFIVRFKQ
ncbi:glucosyltransferase domain-containing protein [uncultured Selenomonas sp.]|uniref:glucosyltransferase domain-containing protein n=1 Tax=uncultured Selenomonas sp. TaxID=159275 RepID=UPI0025D2CD45|nr:glucosyltransferase domain-containing protein [uncultured Selenomonas sp.]